MHRTTMNDFIELTDNEILMGFVASCIESVAKATNKDYKESGRSYYGRGSDASYPNCLKN